MLKEVPPNSPSTAAAPKAASANDNVVYLNNLRTTPHQTSPGNLPMRLLQWLMRVTKTELEVNDLDSTQRVVWNVVQDRLGTNSQQSDWQSVALLCGYGRSVFENARSPLPLTAAEISFFQRDHGPRRSVCSFWADQQLSDLPPALVSLYEIYLSQARHDVEATLMVAQASGSTRVARVMADLLSVGAFAEAHRTAQHLAGVYAISGAFDTALLIDQANHEAACRLALPIEHTDHLLKLAPDDIIVLADQLLQKSVLAPQEFLRKAQLLAEARADVNRFAEHTQFAESITQGDLPIHELWVQRICAGYARLLLPLVADLPELAILKDDHAEFRA